jgi:Iap family predicted aminopeptidase
VRLLPLLLVAAVLVGCDSGGESEPQPPQPPPPPAEITKTELGEHLSALQRIADENGGNRAAGTPGYSASVDYVAERLREARWRVQVQEVPFPYFELKRASMSIGGRRLRRARDFQVLSYSGSGRAGGRLHGLGDGCSEDDFAGLRSGELPLVERGVCFFRIKALNAQRAGAPALVVFGDALTRRGVPSGTLAGPGIRIPVVLVSARALRDDPEVQLEVDATSERRETQNVIAETPGGEEGRVVMAGGHLDSVAGGPGINDNGSGAATLIELAEAIGSNPPGARVRVAFWGAEELGLLGSRHYVRSLSRGERRRIRAYVNLDMVGSPNAVPELYSDGDARLARVLRGAAGAPLGKISAGGSSDHAPFQEAGVPVNGLYTGSSERGPGGRPRDPCYHLACDTIDNVDRPVLLRMARATAEALRDLSARHR